MVDRSPRATAATKQKTGPRTLRGNGFSGPRVRTEAKSEGRIDDQTPSFGEGSTSPIWRPAHFRDCQRQRRASSLVSQNRGLHSK